MPLLWLKVAVGFYAIGLLWATAAVSRPCNFLGRVVMPALSFGAVFHFVSLVEAGMINGHLTLAMISIHVSESMLAFMILSFFFLIYLKYRTLSPGLFIFPLVFLLTFASTLAQQPPQFASPTLRSGWIFVHVALIFTGYAALFLSFGASILYLLQERSLKAKQLAGFLSRLPALEVIDDIGYKSLLLGFPFMTFGLIAGAVIAQSEFGSMYFQDPKIVLSLLMWAVYMVLLYTRWNSGWRGKRAAYLATFAFLTAVGAWAANYFSGVHRFIAQ